MHPHIVLSRLVSSHASQSRLASIPAALHTADVAPVLQPPQSPQAKAGGQRSNLLVSLPPSLPPPLPSSHSDDIARGPPGAPSPLPSFGCQPSPLPPRRRCQQPLSLRQCTCYSRPHALHGGGGTLRPTHVARPTVAVLGRLALNSAWTELGSQTNHRKTA